MKHMMFDLETLGTGDNAAIVQIGAVLFDPWEGVGGTYTMAGMEFNAHILLEDPRLGVLDAPCVNWWMQQSQRARDRVFGEGLERVPLHIALRSLKPWLKLNLEGEPLDAVWSLTQFDWKLLEQAYKRVGVKFPFRRKQNKDYGTLKTMGASLGIEEPLFVGVQHDAVDDSFHQATYAAKIIREMGVFKGGASTSPVLPKSEPEEDEHSMHDVMGVAFKEGEGLGNSQEYLLRFSASNQWDQMGLTTDDEGRQTLKIVGDWEAQAVHSAIDDYFTRKKKKYDKWVVDGQPYSKRVQA